MAINFKILAKHNLSIGDEDKLLQEVSTLYNANVYYGFESQVDLTEYLPIMEWDKGENPNRIASYLLKKIEQGKDFPNVYLIPQDYLFFWLKQTFGDKAGAFPGFMQYWSDDVDENNKTINSFTKEAISYHLHTDNHSIEIYKESIGLRDDIYQSGWYNFFEDVLFQRSFHHLSDLIIEQINTGREIARLYGSDCAYYLCGENHILKGLGQLDEAEMKWNEIVFEIEKSVGKDKIINLRKVLFDENYRNKLQLMVDEDYDKFPVWIDDLQAELSDVD